MADVDPQEPTSGNPAVERAAIQFVIECERRHGRTATDARGSGLGGAGDVESRGDGDHRTIEVKAFSKWGLRSTGLLLFTPAQLREAERNAEYYVYIVENVAQGDPSRFELRMLHGEDLLRVLAGAKPQRFYVPVRKADYERLTQLCVESEPLLADDSLPAPKFDIVARPYERSTHEVEAVGASSPNDRDLRYQEFLGSILEDAKRLKPDLTKASRVHARSFYYLSAGRVGFLFGILFSGRGFNVELYINPKPVELNKALFDALYEHRVEIETAIGSALAWERLDDREGSRIVARRAGATINDSPESLEELRAWAVAMLIRFAEVFRPLIRELR